jgi:hypothetical protein
MSHRFGWVISPYRIRFQKEVGEEENRSKRTRKYIFFTPSPWLKHFGYFEFPAVLRLHLNFPPWRLIGFGPVSAPPPSI